MGIFSVIVTRQSLSSATTSITTLSRPDPSVYAAALLRPSASSAVPASRSFSTRSLRPDPLLKADPGDYRVCISPLSVY